MKSFYLKTMAYKQLQSVQWTKWQTQSIHVLFFFFFMIMWLCWALYSEERGKWVRQKERKYIQQRGCSNLGWLHEYSLCIWGVCPTKWAIRHPISICGLHWCKFKFGHLLNRLHWFCDSLHLREAIYCIIISLNYIFGGSFDMTKGHFSIAF